jgi:N-methylhydantoinase B
MAAHRIGKDRLIAMVEAQGLERVEAHAAALMDYAQRMVEEVITAIPDGSYTFEDGLKGSSPHGDPIPIRCQIEVAGPRMTVDFTGSGPQTAGNLNAVEAVARSAALYCVRLLAREAVPVNDGCFAPVTVVVPPHSVLNPDPPAAVSAGNVETSQRIVDVVLGALAQALPERIPAASQGTMNNVTIGGPSFVFYETIGGGHGGGPAGEGLSGRHSHMTNTRNTPVEALEHDLLLRIVEYALREGSGGDGRHRGGDGIRRTYEFLAPATVTINSERRYSAPYGLHGGEPGQVGRNCLLRDGIETDLGGKATIQMQPGDRLIIETPGGGGWR